MALKANKIAVAPPMRSSSTLSKQMRRVLGVGTLTLFATMLLVVYLAPMAYAFNTAVKERHNEAGAPLWPAAPATFTHEGEQYDIYQVPTAEGMRELALVKKGREQSTFIDPAQPATPIEWTGRWRTLDQVWSFSPRWGNFREAWTTIGFGRLFINTFLIAIIGTIGTVISSTVVAYGFSRFRIPGKSILFMILIATIILPPQVTLIPTYTVYSRIGWVGTWLPLLVPHFFANAYNVFLLRQFFMGIPREMDEAAMIDGATPIRTLMSVIVPQAIPAIIAVSLFHFFFAWNDFFGPLIYLTGRRELWPISVGINDFNSLYSQQPHLIQSTAVMAMAVPIVIFFLAQRFFMRGVVVTGVEK
ncbi:MAG TPA: carbohydrate ABC transporter permease [Herpetosiphonaceae bacterium]|nr:carbohydrate ABC transporter permease [Herpetosiphonaceae bacterium]